MYIYIPRLSDLSIYLCMYVYMYLAQLRVQLPLKPKRRNNHDRKGTAYSVYIQEDEKGGLPTGPAANHSRYEHPPWDSNS